MVQVIQKALLLVIVLLSCRSFAQQTPSINPQLHSASGDVYIEHLSHGVVTKSPDGTCWRIKVTNDGQLITQAVPCIGQNKALMALRLSPTFGQDCYINNYAPTTISDKYVQNPVGWWTNSNTGSIYQSMAEFPIPNLPVNAVIDSAYLYLYHFPMTGIWLHSGTNSFFVRRITSPWIASSTNWNTRPTTTTANQVSVSNTTFANADRKINVTAMIQDMFNSSSGNFPNNYGFMFEPQNLGVFNMAAFGSAECIDIFKRPQLFIYYSFP